MSVISLNWYAPVTCNMRVLAVGRSSYRLCPVTGGNVALALGQDTLSMLFGRVSRHTYSDTIRTQIRHHNEALRYKS
jgi:hypothetical protein